MRRLNLKVIVLLLTAMLVLALVAPVTMAQDDDHSDTAAAETETEAAADDGHAVEATGMRLDIVERGVPGLDGLRGRQLAHVVVEVLCAGLECCVHRLDRPSGCGLA